LAEHVTDYQTAGPNKLGFERYYNYYPDLYQYNGNSYIPTTFPTALGLDWRSNFGRYLRSLSWNGTLADIVAERADGALLSFGWNGSQWVTDSDTAVTLTQSGDTFTLVDSDDTVETYALDTSTGKGTLTSIRTRNGYTQLLNYNSSKQPTSVTDSYGRTLGFGYQNGLLSTVTTPDGLVLTYGYIASGLTSGGALDLLASVSYSTNPATSQTYLYENTTTFPTALIGIVDENGDRFATWSYDGNGQVVSSQEGNGAELTSFSGYFPNVKATATNGLGQPTQSWFETIVGAPKIVEIDRKATATTTAASQFINYDTNARAKPTGMATQRLT
jgi:hypothetical protein